MMQAYLIGRQVCLTVLAGSLLACAGCVERKLTIASDPPGALTYINDTEVGRTPVTVPFLWYGDYDVRLRAERTEAAASQPAAGTQRGDTTQTASATQPAATTRPTVVQYALHTHRRAEAPWFQWLGIDLVTELIPVEFKDEKLWAFNIPPVPMESDEQLVQNAKALQAQMNTPIGLQRNPPLTPTTGPAPLPGVK
jgi:hypothetical protein